MVYVGNLSSTRTFQDCRDAVRAYWLLMNADIQPGEYFNIAGEEAFRLNESQVEALCTSSSSGAMRCQHVARISDNVIVGSPFAFVVVCALE